MLLTEMLREGDEQLIITVKSDTFIYDSGTHLEIRDPVTLLIHRADLKESGFRTEISMLGSMSGEDSKKYPCSFYFILNRNIHVIPRKRRCIEVMNGKCMTLPVKTSNEKLHDALFHLVLKGVNSGGDYSSLSEGKGYLLFER